MAEYLPPYLSSTVRRQIMFMSKSEFWSVMAARNPKSRPTNQLVTGVWFATAERFYSNAKFWPKHN